MEIRSLDEFRRLSKFKKHQYFDHNIQSAPDFFSEKELNKFLKKIVLDSNEGDYVRLSALKGLINFILIGELQNRHGLTVLIDEWEESKDVHLELERCKSLFLFYRDASNDIEQIYQDYLDSQERELVGESYLRLGLIGLQNALQINSKNQFIDELKVVRSNFLKSAQTIENRIDSKIYKQVVDILVNLSKFKRGSLEHDFKTLSKLIFEKDSFTFGKQRNPFYLSLYSSLKNLKKIVQEDPSSWLNIKEGLDKIYVNYCDLINYQLRDRLNESALSTVFKKALKEKFIQPYFASNFRGEKKRIDVLLKDEKKGSDRYNFLSLLKEQLESPKKKGNQQI